MLEQQGEKFGRKAAKQPKDTKEWIAAIYSVLAALVGLRQLYRRETVLP